MGLQRRRYFEVREGMGLTLTKRKGSPFWYVRGTVKGATVYESTGIAHADKTRPSKLAEDYRDARAREIVTTSVYGRSHNATFLDAAVSYLEAGGSPRFLGELKAGNWTGLIGKLGDHCLKDMDQSALNRLATVMYPKCNPATINRQFWTPFIAVWNHASKGNNPLCKTVAWQRPHSGIKKAKPRVAVSYEEAITFINGCDWHAAKILFFLFWSGCRPNEAFNLNAACVHPELRWAAIEQTKTEVPRGIPLHEALIPLLAYEKEQAELEERRGGSIFVSWMKKPYAFRQRYNDAGRVADAGGGHMKSAIRSAQKRTGLHIVPYQARHTVSTYLIWPGGVNPHIKDELLGHADASDMSKHYVHLPRAPLIEAISVLPDPRKMGLREDLWKMEAIREMAKSAYTATRSSRLEKKKPCKTRALSKKK